MSRLHLGDIRDGSLQGLGFRARGIKAKSVIRLIEEAARSRAGSLSGAAQGTVGLLQEAATTRVGLL